MFIVDFKKTKEEERELKDYLHLWEHQEKVNECIRRGRIKKGVATVIPAVKPFLNKLANYKR